jgi:His/Glu/Gln/Arg/opine family amino acid ABC transporter permease subunit
MEDKRSRQRLVEDKTPRIDRGTAGIMVFIVLILFLLYRGGVFTAEYWQTVGDKFLANFIQEKRYMMLVKGLWATIQMTLIAGVIGIIIGLLLSLIRVAYRGGARIGILNLIANLYITVIRGTPVMVQILIWNFTIFGSARNANTMLIAALAFGLNSGAYVAEIFRAGIESLDPGQMEAGRSLGLSYRTTMQKIVLPQATKHSLPTLFNELITLVKETSIAGYIGIDDLTRGGQNIQSITLDSSQPLLMVALIYLVLVLGMTALMNKLERRLARSDRH